MTNADRQTATHNDWGVVWEKAMGIKQICRSKQWHHDTTKKIQYMDVSCLKWPTSGPRPSLWEHCFIYSTHTWSKSAEFPLKLNTVHTLRENLLFLGFNLCLNYTQNIHFYIFVSTCLIACALVRWCTTQAALSDSIWGNSCCKFFFSLEQSVAVWQGGEVRPLAPAGTVAPSVNRQEVKGGATPTAHHPPTPPYRLL